MTADATDDNAPPGGMGTEIITHTLPSYNEDDDAQRLEDVAELPFGNDAPPEDEEHRRRRSSNQTRSFFNFNKRTIILGSGIGAILLFFVAAAAGRKYQSNNNSMVIESLNGAPSAAKSPKAPTAKSTKATTAPTGECDCYDPNFSVCVAACGENPTEDQPGKCCGWACRLLQSEPMEEDVPLHRRIELIHDLNGKADASYSFKHNLISTQSCDALIQHIEAAHADDIESGIELPTASSEHAVAVEASETYTAFNGGIENQYNQKLSAGKLVSLIGKDETRKLIDYFHESLGDLVINSIVLIRHGLPTDGHYEIGWHTDDCETVEVTLNDDYEGGRLLHLNLDGVHATDTRTGTAIGEWHVHMYSFPCQL